MMLCFNWVLVLMLFSGVIVICFILGFVGGKYVVLYLFFLIGIFMFVIYFMFNLKGISCFLKY